jgi:heptosyltransferase I
VALTPSTFRVLLVKTSSLGDLVHTLSAVEEARRHRPDMRLDWVCEEALVDIPRLAGCVDRVIPVAIRRWRRSLFRVATWKEIRQCWLSLRARRYDRVIDAQGLIKTMWITASARCASEHRWGYSRSTVKEPLSALACGRHLHSPPSDHAIERLRHLFASALDYVASGAAPVLPPMDASKDSREVFFLHGTSRQEKSWPLDEWISLGQQMSAMGFQICIPSGSEPEFQQAQRIASGIGPQALALERLSIAELAVRIRRSAGVVGVDSGLMHLAVALSRPTVAVMTADHQPKFLATRFAPFWASHARVVAPGQAFEPIPASKVLTAWQAIDRGPTA